MKKKNRKPDAPVSPFAGLPISDLESYVDNCIVDARVAQKEMVEVLLYLKVTGRYKENKRYERATFYQYIEDRFNIRKGTYMEMQRAFAKFPQETVEFGVGLVSKVIRQCGPVRSGKVLADLLKAKETAKTELKRAKIEKIIQDNTTRRIKKSFTDWRAMYEAEAAAHQKTKDDLSAAYARINELEEQVVRLERTAERYSEIRRVFEQPIRCEVGATA